MIDQRSFLLCIFFTRKETNIYFQLIFFKKPNTRFGWKHDVLKPNRCSQVMHDALIFIYITYLFTLYAIGLLSFLPKSENNVHS